MYHAGETTIGRSMRLTLYTKYRNSAGERVRIALALKSISYNYLSVGSSGEISWDEYERINPQKLMPALKIGEELVPQATAILEYLEEVFPKPSLLPSDPVLRAQARGFAQHIVSEMHAIDVIRVRRFLHNQLLVDQSSIYTWQTHWLAVGFTALEEILAKRKTSWRYCFSNSPGWADLHLIPQVRKGITRFNLDLAQYPHIDSIYRDCIGLPAFIAASPQVQEDFPWQICEPELK
jgi:maleylacetoacetate isomerase